MSLFLLVLALLIHFILLSNDRFNWLQGPSASSASTAMQVEPLVDTRNLVAGVAD